MFSRKLKHWVAFYLIRRGCFKNKCIIPAEEVAVQQEAVRFVMFTILAYLMDILVLEWKVCLEQYI